jgi:hypothetical protein
MFQHFIFQRLSRFSVGHHIIFSYSRFLLPHYYNITCYLTDNSCRAGGQEIPSRFMTLFKGV